MIVLLDTHTFLWFIEGSAQLSQGARQLIEAPQNTRLVSIASLWEMAIKSSIGKLVLPLSMPEVVERHIYGNAMELYAIVPSHLERLRQLPFHHRDPFDRLLAAQSPDESMPLLSRDPAFDLYGVDRRW
jgi:PIN domain nuclease of toxin-antitoxin system